MNTADEEPREEKHEASSGKGDRLESSNVSSKEEGQLRQQIVELVEFYFSDEKILHDAFLLKHVRRNREGYVSLKLMASFRKLRSLAANWELLRDALRSSSSQLEVNSEGTKVRRREPLPDYDETAPWRTVICYPLAQHVTVKDVAQVFSRCGPICMIGVLRPGGPVPPCAKPFLKRHAEVYACVAAVIEYENHDSASLAVREASAVMPITLLAAPGSARSRGDSGRPQRGATPGGSRGTPNPGRNNWK